MKFQRYCYESDIDLTNDICRSYGNGKVFGYIIADNVFLMVSDAQSLFCHFYNDTHTELTDDFLYKWGNNISSFIKDTTGTVVNLRLAIDVPNILRHLSHYETGHKFDLNNTGLYTVASRPFIELKKADDSFFITVNGIPLYDKGIVNEKVAKDLFKMLSDDVSAYINKRWPIQ